MSILRQILENKEEILDIINNTIESIDILKKQGLIDNKIYDSKIKEYIDTALELNDSYTKNKDKKDLDALKSISQKILNVVNKLIITKQLKNNIH